jgi:hypothetical protein
MYELYANTNNLEQPLLLLQIKFQTTTHFIVKHKTKSLGMTFILLYYV